MRLGMKSTRNKISIHHKINSDYITFHCGRNEMKFRFGDGPRKTAHSVTANNSVFDEISACADVSFRMILFRVVLTNFITRNEI